MNPQHTQQYRDSVIRFATNGYCMNETELHERYKSRLVNRILRFLENKISEPEILKS